MPIPAHLVMTALLSVLPGEPVGPTGDVRQPEAVPEAPAPGAQPQDGGKPGEEEIDRAIRELQTTGNPPAPVQPTSVAGVPYKGRGSVIGTRVMREGTFLLNRRGRLATGIRGLGNQAVFVFDPDAEGHVDMPLIMVPCEALANLQSLAASAGPSAAFLVSGQVLAYRGRNYLLLTRPAEIVRAAAPAPAAATPGPSAQAPSTPGPKAGPEKPSSPGGARKTIEDMEAAAPPPAPALRDESARPMASVAPQRLAAAYREGTFLASRRGRLTRGLGGALTFVFDTDTGAQADAPLQLMPCVNLMALEDLAARGNDAVTIAVSGQIFTHQGQSYLLPTMYVIQPKVAR